MFTRRAFNTGSFSPFSFAFEIIDDGEQEQSGYATNLSAAYLQAEEYELSRKKKKKRRGDEFALMALM